MKCRAIEKSGTKTNIVWFGSAGKNVGFQPVVFTEFDSNGVAMLNGKTWGVIAYDLWETTLPLLPTEKPTLPLSPSSLSTLFGLNGKGIYIPGKYFTQENLDSFLSFWLGRFQQEAIRGLPVPVYEPWRQYYLSGNKIPADNYNGGARGVRDSLIQRLSVIKGELWYKASYGLPLADKIKNKGIYDSIIVDIITSHPDVKTLISFSSAISKQTRKYEFSFTAMTVHSEEVSVKYAI